MDGDLEPIQRGDRGEVNRIVSEKGPPVQGPLGIWPFPILNAILSDNQSKVEITEINRDERGNIESIEEIRL